MERQKLITEKRRWGSKNGAHSETPFNHTIIFNPTNFGLKPAEGEDPLEKAVTLDASELIRILRDLSRGGVRLLARNLSSGTAEVLTCLAIPTIELDGHDLSNQRVDDIRTAEDLTRLAQKTAVLEDRTKTVTLSLDNPAIKRATNGLLIIANGQPAEATSFGKKISIDTTPDGNGIVIMVNGQPRGYFDSSSKRFLPDLASALERAKALEERIKIKIPETSTGVTTLEQEVRFLQTYRTHLLRDFEPPTGAVNEAILKILLTHCESSVQVSKNDREHLAKQIMPFIKKNVPVPISISMAIGTRIPNPLKFKEEDNLPTYAWLHFGNFMAIINEKIKRLYPQGIKTVVFDEATLFGPMMGITKDSINRHLRVTQRLLAAVGAPVEIIPLEEAMFPVDEVNKIKANVDDDKIYAIVCSRSDMAIPEVMGPLYSDRQNRSYAQLKQLTGLEIWEDSRRLAMIIARYLEYRKKMGLFETLAGPIAVDATVTDKDGRVVFDVTSNTLFNHAMPVVQRNDQGMHKVHIVPEYRVKREYPNAKPVKIDKRELDANSGFMTFLYEVK